MSDTAPEFSQRYHIFEITNSIFLDARDIKSDFTADNVSQENKIKESLFFISPDCCLSFCLHWVCFGV